MEDTKKKYLDKIRSMGILRKESEMPKRKASTQVEEAIKKSGRLGFEPVSSEKAHNLAMKKIEQGTVAGDLQKEFSGEKFDKDKVHEKENKLLEQIYESEDPKSKRYLQALRTRMKTA